MVFLYDRAVYGLYDCGSERNRKEWCSYGDRDPRFLRVPCDLGVHDLCVFPYGSVVVSAVYVLMDPDGTRGDYLFCSKFPENPVREVDGREIGKQNV